MWRILPGMSVKWLTLCRRWMHMHPRDFRFGRLAKISRKCMLEVSTRSKCLQCIVQTCSMSFDVSFGVIWVTSRAIESQNPTRSTQKYITITVYNKHDDCTHISLDVLQTVTRVHWNADSVHRNVAFPIFLVAGVVRLRSEQGILLS